MNKKTLKNGFFLPDIGLGTGGPSSKIVNEASWKQAIHEALEIGYQHIDCAPTYSDGLAEKLVGEIIQNTDLSKLVISTKVSPKDLARKDFINSVESSLKRLKINSIDLLYIHASNPNIPLKETMKALDECVTRGLAKHIAVSNFNTTLLKEAQSLTNNKIVANQIEYNLSTREQSHCEGCDNMESEILPYCQANDILVVAYRPVDRGALLEPNPLLDELTKKYNKTRAQLAINWLISQKNVVTIPRSDKKEHLVENFEAGGWYMEKTDVERLRREYPQQKVTQYRYY